MSPIADWSSGGTAHFPTKMQTTSIFLGSTISTLRVKITFTGMPRFFVSANGGTNWDEIVSLTSNVGKAVTLLNPGTDLRFRAVGMSTRDYISYIEIEDTSATN